MNTSITRIEINNLQQRAQLTALFDEYASALLPEIRNRVVEQLFSLSYFHGFLCFVGNDPAGFAICFESYSTYRARKVLNIHDFMVGSMYRGKGLGKVLLSGIEDYCSDNDYLKITLEVNQENVSARKLYRSSGFEDFQATQKELLHWQKYLDRD